MESVGKCVIGMQRKKNEDTIYISSDKDKFRDLYIVADGMGGHNAGEVASSGAIDAFVEFLNNTYEGFGENTLDILVAGVQHSNKVIFDKSLADKKYSGMGTTFIAVAVVSGKLYVTHVGDSRLYMFKRGRLRQITKDHSYVMEMVKQGRMTLEEASVHPKKNIITRALGTSENIDVDTYIEILKENDIIMICSDGLSNMLSDKEIKDILKNDLVLDEKAQALVGLANEKGGIDNISVVLIKEEVQ